MTIFNSKLLVITKTVKGPLWKPQSHHQLKQPLEKSNWDPCESQTLGYAWRWSCDAKNWNRFCQKMICMWIQLPLDVAVVSLAWLSVYGCYSMIVIDSMHFFSSWAWTVLSWRIFLSLPGKRGPTWLQVAYTFRLCWTYNRPTISELQPSSKSFRCDILFL